VGGLVGSGDNVESSSFSGVVTDQKDSGCEIGGVAGNSSYIDFSYSSGAVRGGPGAIVGGLVGYAGTVISQSQSSSSVSTGTGGKAGGLAGTTYALQQGIENSFAMGTVTGGTSSDLGGLLGYNAYGTSVVNSYSTGEVTGGSGSSLGGPTLPLPYHGTRARFRRKSGLEPLGHDELFAWRILVRAGRARL
jgi:hypothetical protein